RGGAQVCGGDLLEHVGRRDARRRQPRITNYIIPPSMRLPRFRVGLEHRSCPYGPAGAKGIGELPMDGAAPAIFNAVAFATGLNPTTLPLTPETLMALSEAVHA